MLKKLLPLLLAAILLTSCGQPSTTLMEFMSSEVEKIDYEGRTFIIDGGPYFSYQDDNSPQTDALRKRLSDIQKNFNIVFDYCEIGRTTTSTIVGSVYTADIMYRWEGDSLVPFAHGGLLHPLNAYPQYIDLKDTDKYGKPGATEAALANGIPYGIQPTYWPGMQGIECFFIAYNRNMMETLGLTDLHEYYENKTWTWDTFYNFLEQADTLVQKDVTTFQAHTSYLLNTIFLSNGFDFVEVVDGEPRFKIISEDSIHAVEFLQKFDNLEKAKLGSNRWDIEDFVDGKSLTTMAIAKDVTVGDIAYKSEFDYSIMPFPCGPDAEYGKWAQSVTRIYGFAIPLSCPTPEISAHILSELFEPFEEFGTTRDELKNYYANGVFISPTDAEIYFDVDQYVRYDYDDFGFINTIVGAIAATARHGGAVPTEALQKIEPIALRYYNEYIEANLVNYLVDALNITE